MKVLLFIAAAIVTIAVFGWIPFLIVAACGFVYGVYRAARKERRQQSDAWFVERNERGNRYMITDPLDAPMNSSDMERRALLSEWIATNPRMDATLIAFRQRALSDPGYLTTPEGIEAVNGIGSGVFEVLNDRVANWNTNDFRRFGLEAVTAPMPHAA